MPLSFVHPVHRATHRIGLYLDKLGEPGLTQGEAHILAMLAHSGPAKVAELHRGLAHKRLTAKGRKLAHRISSHLLELEREGARGVTAAEIKGFKKVVAALEQQAHYRTQR